LVYYFLRARVSVRAVQRLQEIDTEKREPILLRCSAVQHATRVIRIDTLQRTSKFYDILHEFHSPVNFFGLLFAIIVITFVKMLLSDELPSRKTPRKKFGPPTDWPSALIKAVGKIASYIVTQALYRLVPSAETDEGAVRYLFASASGRSTRIHLRCSPTYTIHWHVISPSKELQVEVLA
uniref:PKD_channel domain-containing protein n=1 Tax=Gongylonema pulchrum TaxID=637853 RepID=A0A183DMT0_9BILA